MAKQRKIFMTHAGELAHRLVRAVRPHGLVANFATSYARSHDRIGVVDEPARVRELESTLGREAVLVMVAEVHRLLPAALGARKGHALDAGEIAFAQMFWPEFMTALGRVLEWREDEAADEREALDRDLLMYRRWAERAPFLGAPVPQDGISPFYDRCALLLDPSTMENARKAAANFEKELLRAAAHIVDQLGRTGAGQSRPAARATPQRSRSRTKAPRKLAQKPAPRPAKSSVKKKSSPVPPTKKAAAKRAKPPKRRLRR